MKKIALFVLLFAGFQSAKAQTNSVKTDTNSKRPYLVVQQMPQFSGGQDALNSYLQKNIIYPKSAKKRKKQGIVYVTFVITKTGKIINVKLLRGIQGAPELDAEALKVIENMPDWIPGKQDGKNVPVQYSLPIKFILQNDDAKK